MATQPSGRIAEERAALRRVATLVGRAAPSEEVLAAVAAEAGRLLEADFAVLSRYDPAGTARVIGTWARTGPLPLAAGTRLEHGGLSVHTLVFRTRQPARIDDYGDASGQGADIARDWGVRSVVGVPISLEGRLWGVIGVASRREQLPADTEAWLAGFTELVTGAIANTQARAKLRGYADEQAALRRVATLVARATSPEQVFAAVTAEVGRLLQVDLTFLSRYDPEDGIAVVGGWSSAADAAPVWVGSQWKLGGRNVITLVFETGRPARTDRAHASGAAADVGRGWGIRSCVGVPISVEGRLWGVMGVAYTHEEPLPADTEARLAGFTGLVATAIANAQARVELRGYAEEQAALRRVATLVAQGTSPAEVFAAVAAEIGRVLAVDLNRVEALGGRISLQSGPGTGTTVEAALPLDGPGKPGLRR